MKKIIILLGLLATLSNPVQATILNGGFEQWSGDQPEGWTLADSGISVSRSGTIKLSGNSAALITVNTADQANTDFRQLVSVNAGQSYNFSTSVYHTEGNIKARLYVNGYQGYSNEQLTGQWQTLNYNYTAASSGTIEVGLRFYDVSGFDGSERVYVDNFEPATQAPPASCADTSANFVLNTDNYGGESSWQLNSASAGILYSDSNLNSNTQYTQSWCLAAGDYTFTINDSYGDGICCSYGSGNYSLSVAGQNVFSGGSFTTSQSHTFTISGGSGGNADLGAYYAEANGLTGYDLKTALHNIIKSHTAQGYSAIWGFYNVYELDNYYENDGSILDIYSEKPSATDSYVYAASVNQCGSYNSEADCYNREHSFPRSWFGGAVEPMNSDIHHIFATDGFVNAKRSSYPYGEVGSASFVSTNGSKLGSAAAGSGYSGVVFEPVDEFKGDVARAYFYIATRYQDQLASWQTNSTEANAALNGSTTQVFENWLLQRLKQWHQQDPVSQKERDRNDAAYQYQGNRNPFVDHPQFVTEIWGN
ncbi:endonuclease [Arsukibacterium sp. UBA3155]|uniref:HNH endonuclease signature motif containing protein n=1 Tax=Arsukibacterium sp. UBA3155 TaxID=1946058 RepID=UPI0025C43739|nr:endonuclease [Arsukibacterium sp. UBA3155]|tara:strand:+ start:144707 stop:146311 length:1605 start_codon:yes stop_codon:yes gene_type:complete